MTLPSPATESPATKPVGLPSAAATEPPSAAAQRPPSPEPGELPSEVGSESPTKAPAVPRDRPKPRSRPTIPAPAPRPRRTRAGGIGVAIVLVAAGLLFTTSATTARGTQFRSERADLADLIAAEDLRVKTRNQRVAALNKQVQREAAANTVNNKAIDSLEKRSASVITAAGLYEMKGPGLTVTLDDAPRDVPVPDQAGPDDLVVHQQDVQAVVNALWAGGAEAMMLQDQRVISTSAVRCVGNTLILQGRVYSPPYRITVIGDVEKMKASLDSSPQIAYYLQYVASLRLGWSVKRSDQLTLPAYVGSLALSHARVAGSTTPSSAGSASSTP
ncbi:MAG TPA: DUF881 domain-containing protein [Kineosporiaceae bacterium]|nr:DUF881 domain-containing protein [Kineosporiaceae bacterium]